MRIEDDVLFNWLLALSEQVLAKDWLKDEENVWDSENNEENENVTI